MIFFFMLSNTPMYYLKRKMKTQRLNRLIPVNYYCTKFIIKNIKFFKFIFLPITHLTHY